MSEEDLSDQGIMLPMSREDLEELEWDNILRKSHVRRGLRRMATEARRQIAAGETEEGGFAIE